MKSNSKSKKILITGASSGFGLLSIADLAQRGHEIIAALRGGEDRLNKVTTELPDQISTIIINAVRSGQIKAVDIEMTDRETFKNSLELIRNEWDGKLGVLVNNAGMGVFGPMELIEESDLRHQMEVNFFGLFALTQTLLPLLRESKGTVINISSIAGLFGFPLYAPYNASKFALEGMSEALYYEMKPHGVKVALVEPGGFKTSFIKNVRKGKDSLESNPVYGQQVKAMREFVQERGQKKAAEPTPVIKLITKLVEAKNPPLRNVIGLDAQSLYRTARLLPEFMTRKIVQKAFDQLFKQSK